MMRKTIRFIVKSKWWVVGICTLLSVFSLFYTINTLGFDTDTSEMLSPDLPFRKAYQKFKNSFPKEIDTFLIVVEAEIPEYADAAAREFVRRLQTEKTVKNIFTPGGGEFFEESGFLYLSLEELEELADHLAMAQPLISRLNQEMSLRGLLRLLEDAIGQKTEGSEEAFASLMNQVQRAVKANLHHQRSPVSWRKILDGNDGVPNKIRRFIFVQTHLDFSSLLPSKQAMAKLNELSVGLLEGKGEVVQIKITGDAALAHEELVSVQEGASLATIASILGVFITLWFAFRSFRLVLITIITLIIGLLVTLGFASVAIGHLNLISVAFAILYIGLGVDYAIHFNLRFKERMVLGESQMDAIVSTACGLGPSLFLCAVSTAIGFYAFLPTSYKGVSELGLISGTGMIISLIISFTILPAFLGIIPAKKWPKNSPSKILNNHKSYFRIINRYGRVIRWMTVATALLSFYLLLSTRFDYDPMNLRDPTSESVSTIKDLKKTNKFLLSSITILAPDEEAATENIRKLGHLETVEKVVTLQNFIPNDQETKLLLIETMDLLLGPQESRDKIDSTVSSAEKISAIHSLLQKLEEESSIPERSSFHQDDNKVINHFRQGLRDLAQFLKESKDAVVVEKMLSNIEHDLLDTLPSTLKAIKKAMSARVISRENLPKSLQERWIGKDGSHRIEIYPKAEENGESINKKFVSQVQNIIPDSTGAPVISLEAGDAVIKAFFQAFSAALGIISFLLFLKFRRVKESTLVILPLASAGVFTVAIMNLSGMSFNFANIIALPLLFGLGVDNGIHMVHQLPKMNSVNPAVISGSTTRGIFFSGITTMCSFGSLAFISHIGMASMGKLLMIGIVLNLICTLVILPGFSDRCRPRNCK